MATRLRRLLLREISLVKRGANPGARVILHKSEEHMPNPLERMTGALRAAFGAATTGKTPDGQILKTADERMSYVDSALEEMSDALAEEQPEPTPVNNTIIKQEIPVPQTEEEILKALPESAREMITKAQTEATAATARATAAEAEVAKAQEASAKEVRIAKADTMLGGKLAGDKEKLADVLKALSPEQTTVLEEVFKGALAQLATGTPVTEEIGKSGKAPVDEASQLVAQTAELRKSRPELSEPQAVTEVLKAHPELYEASLTAGKGA